MKRLWWFVGGAASIALIFAIPFVVNILFDIPAPFKLFVARWEEVDALGYGGDVLAYIGTVVLGGITVFQTRKAHKQTECANQLAKDALVQTEKANELTAQMQKFEQAKFMSMISVNKLRINRRSISSPNYHTPEMDNPIIFDMVDTEYWPFKNCYHVDVMFENISDFPIVEFYGHAKGISSGEKVRYGIKPTANNVYISPHEKQVIRFIIPDEFFIKYSQDGLQIDLEFVNVFDFCTSGVIKIERIANWEKVKGKGYTYQIKKITDVKPKIHTEEESTTKIEE